MRNLIFCLILAASFYGCKEDDSPDSGLSSALVLYTGEPEVDGCGYVLLIADEQYKPVNLPAKYQQDSLKLSVTYTIDPVGFQCGDLPDPVTTIRLNEIRER